jgi:hypothetical protein
MRCLILGLLVHGPVRRSMDISAINWYQSFTHGLLARPEAAQLLTGWNVYGSTTGNPSLVLAVFPLYECFISQKDPQTRSSVSACYRGTARISGGVGGQEGQDQRILPVGTNQLETPW